MSFRLRSLLHWALAVAFLASVVALALWTAVRRPDESLERIRERGVIRIGYAVEAPYSFLKPGGETTGESPELARLVSQKLGIKEVRWQLVDFATLLDGLEAGRYDVIASGLFITPERAHRVAFSNPTFQVWEGLLVPKSNPKNLHSYEGAARMADVRVAVLPGSVEQIWLREAGLPQERMVLVPDAMTGAVAVGTGQSDALALSSPTIRWLAAQDSAGRTEAAAGFVQPTGLRNNGPSQGAFAFRLADSSLRRGWNDAMKEIIGSPQHLDLVRAFGFTEAELPPPAGSDQKGGPR